MDNAALHFAPGLLGVLQRLADQLAIVPGGDTPDRLVHHATILEFDGESVRTKKAKSLQTA